jgi:hypothetical protein
MSSSYDKYSIFATSTLLKCIWAQTEPFGLYLKPNSDSYWLPTLQGSGDIAIMEDVQRFYDKESCRKINRCRLYFQVITLYDLITYDGSQVHPEYTSGVHPTSRTSTVHWVTFHKPSRKHMTLWNEYINIYVRPRITVSNTSWNTRTKPHYNTTYYLCSRNGKLYEKVTNNEYKMYEALRSQHGSRTTTFHNTPVETYITNETQEYLQPVDVTHSKHHIIILCTIKINDHGSPSITSIHSKYSFYRKLPKSLRRLCGKISLPPDGGQRLMEYVKDCDASLIGVSDASVIEGQGTHAWILTTGEMEHLSDPYMKLEGQGPVDGDTLAMSSARGELQGQTALAIMTGALLMEHDATDTPITFYTDNQGVQKSCHNPKTHRIGHHRKANMDLHMEHAVQVTDLNIKHEWVKGHQDKDAPWETIEELYDLNLSVAATLNIYCDRKASAAHQSSLSDPVGDVLPAEKWALFSSYPNTRKITGHLNEGILQTLYTDEIITYIAKKHNMTEDKLHQVDTNGLKGYLRSLRPHNRASIIKLIHRWIPTNEFLHKQHRSDTPSCPRCKNHNETAHHILTCPFPEAQTQRTQALYTCLTDLARANTSKYILDCIEENMTNLLNIPSLQKYKITPPQLVDMATALSDATRHQNILGWENAIRGFTSKYWMKLQLCDQLQSNNNKSKKSAPWNTVFIRSLIHLHKQIWSDRNVHVHGKSIKETHQKLRQRVIEQVKTLYEENFKFSSRYQAITAIPLDKRLRHTTQRLLEWIAKIGHQKSMTEYLNGNRAMQPTIREAFQRAQQRQDPASKYPP